jgi:HAD superfamily hydrolase (TIGR01450 family)
MSTSSTDRLANVKCFLLDMDGTFLIGHTLREGSLRFIEVLREQGKEFLFLTNNSSKNRRIYSQLICDLGLPIQDSKILTSGEATARYLSVQYPKARVFVLGTKALKADLREQGLRIVNDGAELVVLGFDTTLTYKKIWQFCDYVRAGVPYFATHPDNNCPSEKGMMPDIGAMIAFTEASTGRKPDLIVGKPNRMIIEAAAQKMNLGIEFLAMIGDRLYTDIALKYSSGVTAVLLLGGETAAEEIPGSPYQPDFVFNHLGEVADYLLNHDR